MAPLVRLLVTRPEPDAQATVDRLAALDIAAEIAPMMRRQTLSANLPQGAFAGLAVTSTNALRALEDLGEIERFMPLPVFAVGDRTAHEARVLGFNTVMAAEGTLPSLVTAIALSGTQGPLFYPAGKHLSGDMAHALAPHGIMVVTSTVYDMVAETHFPTSTAQALTKGYLNGVLMYSRRTAEIFCSLTADMPIEARRGLPMLCMSEKVAEPLLQNHFSRVLLADYPSEEAMMALALAFARDQTGP